MMQKQRDFLAKAERETRFALRKLEDDRCKPLAQAWTWTKKQIKAAILSDIYASFPDGKWNKPDAERMGIFFRIERKVSDILGAFYAVAGPHISGTLADVRKQELLRALWMLDQATPPHVRINEPAMQAQEADKPEPVGWDARMRAWLEGYASQLNSNLKLHALYESTPNQAAGEVDAARVLVPGAGRFDLQSLLERLYRSEVINAEARTRDAVSAANGGIIEEEIWQSIEDWDVCSTCFANNGKKLEDADGEIPRHPACRCYPRLVPREWADLLRSGNEQMRELAIRLDELGMVKDAMVIPGEDGKPEARLIVRFDEWADEHVRGITGGVK